MSPAFSNLQISVRPDLAKVSSRRGGTRLLEVTVSSPRLPHRSDRLPLNLALCLDRSGSMSGAPLEFVRRAALHLVSQLDDLDRVAVVTFNAEVQRVASSKRTTRERKRELERRMARIASGGGTALFDGWVESVHLAAEKQEAGTISRCLLLTDGMANVGETRPEEICRHVGELRAHGIATSTFGVGVSYNHELLEGMAEGGGGNYHYLESAEQIPAVFARELGELQSVTARRASLRVSVAPGMSVRLLGTLPHDRSGEQITLPLSDVFAGEERTFFVELRWDEQGGFAEGSETAVFTSLKYKDGADRNLLEEVKTVFRFAEDAEVNAAPVDHGVRERAAVLQMAEAARESLRHKERGDHAAARQVFAGALSVHAAALPSPEMAEAQELREKLEEETPLSAQEMKGRHRETYERRNSRK